MSCIYCLRYNQWEDSKWKIGKCKNIDTRIKAFKTSIGTFPDVIILKYVPLLELNASEQFYHAKFKNSKIHDLLKLENISLYQMMIFNYY